MIAISKSKDIPLKLKNDTTQREFEKNIKAKKYIGNDRYKVVASELELLYNNKCAFCETDITTGSYNHIEHYRPKSIYYWLAYSWDNLLLSCPRCNLKKGNEFKIRNSTRVEFQNENFADLHNKISDYNSLEKPYLLNPEQFTDDELKKHFTFNTKGEIIPKSDDMINTIKICDLNRKELIEDRFAILNDFVIAYRLSSNKKETKEIIKKQLQTAINNNKKYIAWRSYLNYVISMLNN